MSYNKRTWLNKNTSSSTSSIVVYDGIVPNTKPKERMTFVQISDCKNIVTLHARLDEPFEDFIGKIKLLKNELELFINSLENEISKT